MILRRVVLLIILVLSSLTVAVAQNSSVENLRSQLSDVQKKEEELQARVRQIEEDLRPENIERYFALNGSTRPEELREQRRRQLQLEKDRALAELDQLLTSRLRLQSAISEAEAAAFQPGGASLQVKHGPGEHHPAVRVLLIAGLIIIFFGGALALFTLLRKR